MTRNPIHRVLSVLRTFRVRFLLTGGQACVLYGGAEFSRDTDIAIMPDEENLDALHNALHELKAEQIAVPPCSLAYLQRGHALHYRCRDECAAGMRLDVMSVMRNTASFDTLWIRRTTVTIASDLEVDCISLPDLVQSKKTQRDKDWPMIRRLIEADYEKYKDSPGDAQVSFWILQARTPALLRTLYNTYTSRVHAFVDERPLLGLLPDATDTQLEQALRREEDRERRADRQYWRPLRKELESIRHDKNRSG